MTPDYEIIAAGDNITPTVKDRLLSLTITDEAGMTADVVRLTLDNRDHALRAPSTGALMAVALGYAESGLLPMGIYTSDVTTFNGPPDTATIEAKATDLGGTLKEQKTRAWDDVSLSDIVGRIAGEHGLTPVVSEALAQFSYEHLDQTGESDTHFLTRLAQHHDALALVKGRSLLFIGRGEGKTASGLPMIPRVIEKTGKMSYRIEFSNREDFAAVEGAWHDEATGQQQPVRVGGDGTTHKLRHPYPNRAEAEQAAKAKIRELRRMGAKLTVTMPGDPTVAAEGQIIAKGFPPDGNGRWSITRVTHTVSGDGYSTTIDAELPNETTD